MSDKLRVEKLLAMCFQLGKDFIKVVSTQIRPEDIKDDKCREIFQAIKDQKKLSIEIDYLLYLISIPPTDIKKTFAFWWCDKFKNPDYSYTIGGFFDGCDLR